MASRASIGEMRTLVRVCTIVTSTDSDGFTVRSYSDIFGAPVWCKWVHTKAQDTFERHSMRVGTDAVLTMYYTPAINERCVVFRDGDTMDNAHAWEIVGVNNVTDSDRFLELAIHRGDAG